MNPVTQAPADPPPANQLDKKQATSLGDSIAASEDLLFDFFDFFDKTIDDVYWYILHRTRVPELAEDITLSVYFSLLQRRRFFWWRNIVQLPTLLSLADKAIASMRKWEEESTGYSYIEELMKCIRDGTEKDTIEKTRLVLQALKNLPLKQHKMAILRFFLNWDAAKSAKALGKKKDAFEKEYEAMLHQLVGLLGDENIFSNTSIEKFLQSIVCPGIEEEKKASLRVALLEKYRSAQMNSVSYAMPIASLLIVCSTFMGCFAIFSTVFVEPISAHGTSKQFAALEVLLTDSQITYQNVLIDAEAELKSLTAASAEHDLADMSIDLAYIALRRQLEIEQEVGTIIDDIRTRALSHIQTSTRIAFAAEM
jgi:DNA-directed RNA polymerase specialized sigma24 family protein